jgi:putative addiction module component (TIGR02574 family)
MGPRIFDFSHLSPAERIELAEQLWDSLEPEPLASSEALAAELRQRRAELRADGNLGIDGNQVLDEIVARNG